MTNTPIEPLVDATRSAATHFAKAAFEVAAGVGALFVGITQTVRRESGDRDSGTTDGPQRVTVE